MFCTTAITVHIDLIFWLSNHVQSILKTGDPWTLTFCLTKVESLVLDTLYKCITNFETVETNPSYDSKMALVTTRTHVPHKCITEIRDSNFDSLYDQNSRFQVTDQFETSAPNDRKRTLNTTGSKTFRSMPRLGPFVCEKILKRNRNCRKVAFWNAYAWSTYGPMLRILKVSQFLLKSKFQKEIRFCKCIYRKTSTKVSWHGFKEE